MTVHGKPWRCCVCQGQERVKRKKKPPEGGQDNSSGKFMSQTNPSVKQGSLAPLKNVAGFMALVTRLCNGAARLCPISG